MKKIKRVLIVGYFSSDPNVYTYATSFCTIFQKLGYVVERFDYRKAIFRNFNLKKRVLKFRPDLIFFIKAEIVSYKIIRLLKDKFDCLLVNFYPDNPFVFWNGNSNSDILNSLPFYDCFLIWSKQLIPVLKSAGCKNVYYFPFAYDQGLFEQEINLTDEDRKKYFSDVCFIGTWDKQREDYLTRLIEKLPHLDLKIWGNLWQERLSDTSILRVKLQDDAIYKTEMIKAFRCSKIVLNFIRNQNMNAHNMKTFEIPASGGFMLTQRTEEQARFLFEEGENVTCFLTVDELVGKINFYLKNNELRKKIVQKSIQKTLDFTMQKTLSEFMNYFCMHAK